MVRPDACVDFKIFTHNFLSFQDIGTPWQDAHRRDLTINALFYNINTGEVEDWTRRGLEDLNLRVIRTPLPPFQTFMDDPLRVLRTVRFACRLGFHIQPEIYEAGSHTNVRDMLAHKISRERICKELLGMLKGDRPALAIHYLHQMGLFESIFQLSETTGALEMAKF
jgi:tRNA nucleotidyltransferase (CCA-adding enzyme)